MTIEETIIRLKTREGTNVAKAKLLVRLISVYADNTIGQMAGILGYTPDEIAKILGLDRLMPSLYQTTLEGRTSLAVAYMLAKFPIEQQPLWYAKSLETPLGDFVVHANAALAKRPRVSS